jgi:DtxR family Mn-dependent transcriptional regulator
LKKPRRLNPEVDVVSETVENYLKAIHTLCRESPTSEAGMTRLAAAVGVTTGTATTMVKKLAAGKLVKYKRFGGVSLTSRGDKIALDIIRRHRLIETFLVDTLKLDWSVVHVEAERLEHAVSPVVLEALDTFLGHPDVDPHGDPIPDADGRLRQPAPLVAIGDCKPGARVRLARILNQGAEFLRFLDRHHLKLDAVLTIESAESGAGTITVRTETGGTITISETAAGSMMVDHCAAEAG